MKYCLIAFLLGWTALSSNWLTAQDKPRGVEVSLGMDGIAYFGDFYERNSRLLRIYPGFNAQLQRYTRGGLGVQLNGGYGQFADQYDQPLPIADVDGAPLTFVSTRFIYGDLRVAYRLNLGQRWQPYASIGAGLVRFTPRDRDGRLLQNRSATRPDGEDYNAIVPQLPGTLGLRVWLTSSVAAGLAYTYRFVPSDYLDNLGVSGDRPGFDNLQSLTLFLSFSLFTEEEAEENP